jgi:hypothetical protein
MLATIRNWIPLGTTLLAAIGFASILSSCAKDPGPLIADPNGATETALPWNEQQKWEREGEAAALNQQRR